MKERLVIKNFGPIKEADLTFGRFNVLIGEQATGKSTVAKLLCICRYFSYIVNFDYFEKSGSSFSYGLFEWGLDEYVQPKTKIEFFSDDYDLVAKAEKAPNDPWAPGTFYDIEVSLSPKSERFQKLISELQRISQPALYGDNRYSLSDIPPTFFQNNVKRIMDYPFYIPIERGLQSIFSLGKNSIQNLSDILFRKFAKLDQIAKHFNYETKIEPLNIAYKNSNGQAVFKKEGQDRFFSLYNAASGYQSTIPVVLLVKYYTEQRKKRKTIIIEEPELNLFPTAQYELMKFLVDKTMNYGNTTLLATHSPYVLGSLNNLMGAFEAAQKDKEATGKVIESRYWLNSDDVFAYKMLPDGTCEDIMDREERMIKSEAIDEVSGILNHEFDNLLTIQYWQNEPHSK